MSYFSLTAFNITTRLLLALVSFLPFLMFSTRVYTYFLFSSASIARVSCDPAATLSR